MIMLVVAIAAGFAVPAVQAGSSQHGQVVVSVSADANSLASCEHGGCPIGQNSKMSASCWATCAGVSGVMPGMAVFHFARVQGAMVPSLDRAMVEQTVPPDPHPPKHV